MALLRPCALRRAICTGVRCGNICALRPAYGDCARDPSSFTSVFMDKNPRSRLERVNWSGRQDSNLRPLAPHASALPGCATPRPRDRMIAQKGLENLTAANLSGEES